MIEALIFHSFLFNSVQFILPLTVNRQPMQLDKNFVDIINAVCSDDNLSHIWQNTSQSLEIKKSLGNTTD